MSKNGGDVTDAHYLCFMGVLKLTGRGAASVTRDQLTHRFTGDSMAIECSRLRPIVAAAGGMPITLSGSTQTRIG